MGLGCARAALRGAGWGALLCQGLAREAGTGDEGPVHSERRRLVGAGGSEGCATQTTKGCGSRQQRGLGRGRRERDTRRHGRDC